jgi:DNA-directed RNA polymerase specialized sigma24 family protein
LSHGAPADERLEGIGEAPEVLGADQPRLGQIVDMKFFCGFSFAEMADLLGISARTAQRDCDKARILLRCYLLDQCAETGDRT